MFPKKNSFLCSLRWCAALSVLVLFIACTANVKKDDQPFNNRLSAENSMMKKRLPLIERENDVLNKENLQHKAKIQDLETQMRHLGLELTCLREKYANDMAKAEEQISSLQETIQKIETESDQRIEALNALNKALETKLAREVKTLNEQIEMQRAAFNQEREQIKQENAKRESNLVSQLNDLKKTIAPKELEISSLKKAITEISIQLGEATALSEALRKARDESVAELKAATAANHDLIKKMDALSNELSLQKKRPKTIH